MKVNITRKNVGSVPDKQLNYLYKIISPEVHKRLNRSLARAVEREFLGQRRFYGPE